MVRQGRFREDLYFRLNVLQIALPPLSQRREDIPLLARHFVERFRQATGKAIEGISPEAMAALLHYSFPGNIRELENLAERAFILCERAEIGLDHLPPAVAAAGRPGPQESQAERSLDRLEGEAIRAALARHGGNRSLAARDLGIHRTTLLRKLKRLPS